MALNSLVATKALPSLIAKDIFLEGKILNGGAFELEGKIKGNVEAETLTIRETGEIIGEVKCKIFNIKGVFSGSVVAEKINISDTAKVNGTLEYKFLSVDYGANINCQLKRIDDIKINFTDLNAIQKKQIEIVQQDKEDKKTNNNKDEDKK
ncbi:MAG: polymer-forming cytoskeletal protein [Rickettsiales bacterium]|jgi:cytoskeletal protein CcmA (bactofilin family)|nr:polymer-forming cytoskeletal protein [Rickettsiales bacterium]